MALEGNVQACSQRYPWCVICTYLARLLSMETTHVGSWLRQLTRKFCEDLHDWNQAGKVEQCPGRQISGISSCKAGISHVCQKQDRECKGGTGKLGRGATSQVN